MSLVDPVADRVLIDTALTAEQLFRSFGVARSGRLSGAAGAMEGAAPMISPDMQTTSLLAKTARLLDSVAEAAWTNGIPAPARWDLHRIGTDAYLAQRDILNALGQGAMPVDPLPVVDIAAALEEAAQTLAVISQAGHNVATKRLEQRVAALARRALALTPSPTRPRL